MKRYSLIVVLHIIGIAFLSVGVYLLVDAGLWFSALMAFLILLAIAVHLYRLQMMQVRMMRHLAESLRYDDMMLSFRSPYKNRSMEDMVDELSEAMRNFRTRVLERNEMEAWQKLIRVLTHEIMNSITPIISLSETLSEREMSEKNYPVMRQGMQTIHRRSKGLLEFVENYRKLKEAGIGTYILFQETYHKESYERLHPTGPKHNYCYHTEAMDRAVEGGIDDVGIGVLFGLELYRYEFAGLLMHAEHLEAVFGVGPHTISVPRIRRADDIDPSTFDNGISDDIFEKIVACIRVAVPYTGMIISTRESKACRERVLRLGVSQISGGSRTSVGGYAEEEPEEENSAQFDVSDNRTLDQVVRWLMELGYIPSFCTACYREGRTGDRFMSLCKSGQIQNCCHPNALMTLKEYLEDYAAPGTKEIGEKLIQAEIGSIPKEKVQEIVRKNLVEIEKGQRDFRF